MISHKRKLSIARVLASLYRQQLCGKDDYRPIHTTRTYGQEKTPVQSQKYF